MAIWQFHLQILSEKEVKEKFAAIPQIMGRDEVEELNGWKDLTSLKELEECLEQSLKPQKSWSPSIKQWGDSESDCVELLYEDEKLSEVSVRLDMRKFDRDMAMFLTKISDLLGGLWLIENRLMSRDLANLYREINRSSAVKYLDNPISFLEDLDKK